MKESIFVSSVQKEMAKERQALRDFIRGDALLGQYFDVFLFEDLPANDRTPSELYLAEVDRAAVYLGLLGNEYGWEDDAGVSPTEREFDRATFRKKQRLVFVREGDNHLRHVKMQALIRKVERQLTRRRFIDIGDLTGKVYASLIRYLEERGVLPRRPFHAAACPGATMRDVDPKRVSEFLKRAREERRLALGPNTLPKDALTSLNLLENGKPTRTAILLFGGDPQRFLPAAEVKCLHLHGTEVVKDGAEYKIFKGTLFEQAAEAIDFVMSKLTSSIGLRNDGPAVAVDYEMPASAVAEAIINAVAHRDYASPAAVQIYVFADRVEVWNPGELPPSLTPESLRQRHSSVPRNPFIAEMLFLARYIEKVGTGTLDMIAGCLRAELPEPEFFQDGDQFVQRLWREWLTADVLARLDLNPRQNTAVALIRQQRHISTGEYQKKTGASRATAKRDLEDLVSKGLLVTVGAGRGAYYELPKKRLTNSSIGSTKSGETIGSETAQMAQRGSSRRDKSAGAKAKLARHVRSKGNRKKSSTPLKNISDRGTKAKGRSRGRHNATLRDGKGRAK